MLWVVLSICKCWRLHCNPTCVRHNAKCSSQSALCHEGCLFLSSVVKPTYWMFFGGIAQRIGLCYYLVIIASETLQNTLEIEWEIACFSDEPILMVWMWWHLKMRLCLVDCSGCSKLQAGRYKGQGVRLKMNYAWVCCYLYINYLWFSVVWWMVFRWYNNENEMFSIPNLWVFDCLRPTSYFELQNKVFH